MTRCHQILKRKGEEIKFKRRKAALEENIGIKGRYALLINLYLLEENFKLETYIEGFLKMVPEDLDGEKIKDILIFASIGEYFANVQFPISYFSHYFSFSEGIESLNNPLRRSRLENILRPYEDGLLLKKNVNEVKLYGIKHYLIAEEILNQLLTTREGENWKGILPQYSKKLIDMFISISAGRDTIDQSIMSILTALYTDKTRDRQVRGNSEFTALLDCLDGPAKIDVVYYLAEKYSDFINYNVTAKAKKAEYKFLAHIYAQCARIRSRYCLLDENSINQEEVEKWINKTDDLIFGEEIFEYDLEDMLGRCYLDRIRNDEKIYFDEEEKNKALQDVDLAIDHFTKTIWYGSPDYGIPGKLEAIRYGLEIIKKWNSWTDNRLVDKIMRDEKAKNYFDLGNDLIREFDEYIDMSTIGQVKSIEQKVAFEKFYCPENKANLIRDLENLSSKVNKTDYHSQYIISSGIFNGYESNYSVEGFSRSQLIPKALDGNKKAQEDAKKAFNHLDHLVKLGITHDVSYSTYKCWFEYAKYMCINLARAYNVAIEWKDKELLRSKVNNPYKNKLIKPYYYLFVITLLRYMTNQGVTEEEVQQRKRDLYKQIETTSKATSTVQDWLSNRTGLGQLYDRSWTSIGLVDSDPNILEVMGKVVSYSSNNNNGYIRIINPRTLCSWGHISNTQPYSKDSDVFFSLGTTGILSESDVGSGKTYKLKIGFSYEKMIASRNSLEKNREQSVVVTAKNDTIEKILAEDFGNAREKNTKSLLEKTGNVKFIPYDKVFSDGTQFYLKGTLPDSSQGRINESDIFLFGNEVSYYGSANDILRELSRLRSFEVKLIGQNNGNCWTASLFKTGIKLSSLLSQRKYIQTKESSEHHMDEKKHLMPDLRGKEFYFRQCEFNSGSLIKGKIEYEGKMYDAKVPSVQNKVKKALQKKYNANKNILVKVKSVNNSDYIVTIIK